MLFKVQLRIQRFLMTLILGTPSEHFNCGARYPRCVIDLRNEPQHYVLTGANL